MVATDSPMPRLAILDIDGLFAETLGIALSHRHDIECVVVETSLSEFVEACTVHRPGVTLIGYWLEDGTAIDCAAQLSARGSQSRLLAIASRITPVMVQRCSHAGFERFLSKKQTLAAVANAIRAPGPSLDSHAIDVGALHFTRRQQEVLGLLAEGLDAFAIADSLFISVHTARAHIKHVLQLMEAPSQLVAVTRAIDEGYLAPRPL